MERDGGLSKRARNSPERIVLESPYHSRERDLSAAGGILLSGCINVTTLRGPSTRVRDCRWRLDVSRCLRQTGARHRLRLFATPVWFSPFPSRGRESANALLPASIPLLHGEQLCEINYSPPALTLIHVARTARLPSPSPPLSHFYYPYYSSLSLLFSLCPFSSFFFISSVSNSFLSGRNSEKNRSLDECWWDLTSGGGEGVLERWKGVVLSERFSSGKRNFYFDTSFLRERLILRSIGINLFLRRNC